MPTSLQLLEKDIKPKVEVSVKVVKIDCHFVGKQILHRTTGALVTPETTEIL